jgi:hypothetical protein
LLLLLLLLLDGVTARRRSLPGEALPPLPAVNPLVSFASQLLSALESLSISLSCRRVCHYKHPRFTRSS